MRTVIELDEQRVLEDIKRVGLHRRQHVMDGDTEQVALYDGMLAAFGDVLVWAGMDPEEIERLVDEAKGVEE